MAEKNENNEDNNSKNNEAEETLKFGEVNNIEVEHVDRSISLKDLDEKKITDVRNLIEKNLKTKFKDNNVFLKKYDLVNEGKISNAAYLLFSKKELRETDIQIGLFNDPSIIKKSKLIRNGLLLEVQEVMDFIEAYILKEYVITGKPQREERWQYPLKALREFIINSIVHKDYQDGLHTQIKIFPDKLEIFNIGKLPYDISLKEVISGQEKSHPRNRLIAEIFRDCGLIERYGSGISRALKEFREYGLIEPQISEKSGGFEVIVFDKEKDIDAVLHYAASCLVNESMESPQKYFQNNVVGSHNLLTEILIRGIKNFVFSSTCEVYGEAEYIPVDEKHPVNSGTPYGTSKRMVEMMIEMYGKLEKLNYVIFRYFNVCGASDDGEVGDSKDPSVILLQNAVRGALGIEPFYLTYRKVDTPDGTPIRDYINVVVFMKCGT